MILPNDKILIAGAGCFGISTAYHLLKRGYKNVTVIDRATTLPAPDAASQDINKIVRTSYSDIFYAQLAKKAIDLWKDEKEWGDTYQESGVLVLRSLEKDRTYTNESYTNDVSLGAHLQVLEDAAAIRAAFPSQVPVASFSNMAGYLNHDGGWAAATQGVSVMMSNVVALGGSVLPGKGVNKLLQQGGKTTGVECADGTIFEADLVILALGSWTASALPNLQLESRLTATGQSIATIQLTKEEADRYKNVPVVLDFDSGFYIFPPTKDNIVKMAIHDSGYTHTQNAISTPRTISSDAEEGLRIPKDILKELRTRLRGVYPELAEKPFSGTRLCWYTDSPDSDWIIGLHPVDPSLMFATAGSGHAYKFLPVIGRLVADAVQGTMDPILVKKFAVDREYSHIDKSRFGKPTEELDLDQLCSPGDLLSV